VIVVAAACVGGGALVAAVAVGATVAVGAPGGAGATAGPGPAAPRTASVPPPEPSVARDRRETSGPPLVVWTRDGGIRAPHPAGTADVADLLMARAGLTLRVVGLLDAIAPFPWRTVVGTLAVGCRPVAALDCPGGVVDRGDRITLSPAAGRWSDATMAYVLRHELAHVWQHATGDLAARRRDLDGIALPVDVDPLEAAADCLAAAWGSPARGNGYLACPAAGADRMRAVFEGTPVGPPDPDAAPGPDGAAASAVPAGAGSSQATEGARPDRGAGTTPSSTARTAASVRPSTSSLR